MMPLYSIRLSHPDGTFTYYTDVLGHVGFTRRTALLIIREQALRGFSADLVRL